MQRFTDKKTLTSLVNLPGWIIYRDSVNGMYARNENLCIDHPLLFWNITLNNPNLNKCINIIRDELIELEDNQFA